METPFLLPTIVDSTLREGEQFVAAEFTSDDRLEIAELLAEFGVEYLELTSVCSSRQARLDVERLTRMRLGPKIVTHIRCLIDDARVALDTELDGINVFIGASSFIRDASHHKSIAETIDLASELLTYIRSQAPHVELRFSPEDSFRTPIEDLLRIYAAIDALGVVDRLGVADTVGIATYSQVIHLVGRLREMTHTAIEFHGHNDSGCALANAYAALEAGATHIDTTVLGIGERNGITALEALIARLYTVDTNVVMDRYRLDVLPRLSALVANKLNMPVPFNLPITSSTAFTHKAGVHGKAVLSDPRAYESLNPADFGLGRTIAVAHQLTGWHAIQARAQQLGLRLAEGQLRAIAQEVRERARQHHMTIEEVDALLRRRSEPLAAPVALLS